MSTPGKRPRRRGILALWYNRKTLGVSAEYKGHDKLFSPKFAKTLCSEFMSLVPLYNFLRSLDGEQQ